MAWVAPTSASGYLVPRLALARRGLDVSRLFASERFMGGHGAVAVAVFSEVADVGATFAHFEGGDPEPALVHAGFEDAMPERRATVVLASGPIPADMIAVHPSVPMAMRISLAGALCRLPADPVGRGDLALVIGADDFQAVSMHALAELQSLMEASLELTAGV